MKKNFLRAIMLALVLVVASATAFANGASEDADVYPSKEVSVIVIAKAGGGTDAMARAVSTPLETILGKPFVITNNGSAGGLIAMEDIYAADPDGYTLGVFSNTDVANFAYTQKDCLFTVDDFTYLAGLNQTADIVVLKKGSPFNNLDEFIAYAKDNPEKLTVGLPSPIQEMSLSLFENGTDIDVTGVVYGGGNKVFADLLGGHVDAGILSAKFIKQAADNGLVVFGLMLPERLPSFPDTPTFVEQGYDVVNPAVRMLVAPKGLSEDIIETLEAALEEGFKGPMADNITAINEVPVLLIGDELDKFLADDFAMRKNYYESR